VNELVLLHIVFFFFSFHCSCVCVSMCMYMDLRGLTQIKRKLQTTLDNKYNYNLVLNNQYSQSYFLV